MEFHGLLSYPSNSNAQHHALHVHCQVTASRKRPSEVDLDRPELNDLQEIIWRDVDQMNKVTTRESQVVAEQLRRKRMKYLCSQLESLLPSTPTKLDRCGLYEKTINYIRKLEEDLHQVKTGNDNIDLKVAVEIYDLEAIITITCQRKPTYMWRILEELEMHGLDVKTSQLFTGESFVLLSFHVNFRDNISHDPAQIRSSLEYRLKLTY